MRSRLLKGLFSISWRRDTVGGLGGSPSVEEKGMPGRGNSSVEAVGEGGVQFMGAAEGRPAGAELVAPGSEAEAGAAGVGSRTASGTVKEGD